MEIVNRTIAITSACVVGIMMVTFLGCRRKPGVADQPSMNSSRPSAPAAADEVKEKETNEPLNWKQAEAALSAPDVHTVREFFTRLSEQPISATYRRWFADVEKREAEFDSLEKHIAEFYEQAAHYQEAKKTGLDMSRQAIRKRLAARIKWKTGAPALDRVTREYQLYTSLPTAAERTRQWGPVWFEIFTDDRGELLGWINVSELKDSD